MELARLIEALSIPSAYPHAVEHVEARQTHISAVFLAGPFVYKVKKPVNLGFLDFTTLEKRRHFCEEEVRLNRRLAPTVYKGAVPVTRDGSGLRVEGTGDAVEWAVKMERLPEDASLRERLLRGQAGVAEVESLARRLAAFHAAAEGGERVAAWGRFDVVAGNARDNFGQSLREVGATVSPVVWARLQALTEEALARLCPLIEARAARAVPRDTHGDLHLDHVYLFPDRPTPADLVAIDCIEFNERFRFADPVADMAFLVMDLLFHGRRDLARAFADAYFRAAGDDEGRALLPFYTSYRAAVRAKVEGLELREAEVPEAERAGAAARAKRHWLLALSELEQADRKHCMILVGGLPGAGKSTLARALANGAGFTVVRSDVVRKELAGAAPVGDLYTPEWSDRTYAECLRRAEAILFEGGRVVVDANFREELRRRSFLDAAKRWGAPAVFLACRADADTARARLAARKHDASDADWAVYQQAAAGWEEPGPETQNAVREIDAGGVSERMLQQALNVLREMGLYAGAGL